jgi:hypothetical protein
LGPVAPHVPEHRFGGGILDAFGHHLKPERMGDPHHQGDDGPVAVTQGDALDKGLVQLQLVERQAAQVVHGRIACPEIIKGQAPAPFP